MGYVGLQAATGYPNLCAVRGPLEDGVPTYVY